MAMRPELTSTKPFLQSSAPSSSPKQSAAPSGVGSGSSSITTTSRASPIYQWVSSTRLARAFIKFLIFIHVMKKAETPPPAAPTKPWYKLW